MMLSDRQAWMQSAVCLILMAATIIMESCTDIDMTVQRHWYDAVHGTWLIDASVHQAWRWLFYDGMKRGVAGIGGMAVLLFCAGCVSGGRTWRRTGLLVALSCAATPLLVSTLKAVTGIYCPRQLTEFGGHAAYRHILMMFSGVSGGRCFPGGHASGGFALTVLFFCASGRALRTVLLAAALGLGWTMGLYQMMRGEHFLSHTIMSMLLAWQMNILLVLFADRMFLPRLARMKTMRRRRAVGS